MGKKKSMRRVVSLAVAFVLLAAQIMGGAVANTVTESNAGALVFTDFSDGMAGTWKVAGTGAAYSGASVVDHPDQAGQRALRLTSLYQNNPVYNTDWPMVENGAISVRMKSISSSTGNATLGLAFRATGPNYNLINLMGNQGGTKNAVLAQTQATWSDPFTSGRQALEMNKWYTVTLTFVNRAVTLTVDDGETSNVVINNQSWSAYNTPGRYLGFFSWGTSQTYLLESVTITGAQTPDITAQPADRLAYAGDEADFSVKASVADGGVLSYQWEKSLNGGASWAAIAGATEAQYKTGFLPITDNGAQYRCAVKNTLDGSFSTLAYSGAATLTVLPSLDTPVIARQPADALGYAGQAVTFSVEAANESGNPLSYNWQIHTGSAWTDAPDVRDGASYTYTVPAGSNGYQFRCVVMCGNQSTTSNAAKLTTAAAWPESVKPFYSDFADEQALSWKNIQTGADHTATLNGERYRPQVVYDPSAMNEKALRIGFAATANYIQSPDLPTGITDGEYAMRVKVVRPTVDAGTAEVRFGLIYRSSSTSVWNEITRSGSGWYAQRGTSDWSSNLNSEGVFSPGQWHTLRAVFIGKTITLYFDGIKVVDAYEWSGFSDASGGFGIRSFYANQIAYIDNLYVGPIRSEDELPPEFAVKTPRPDPFDYEKDYADDNASQWINASNYAAYPGEVVETDGAEDGKALKLEFPGADLMLADTQSAYAANSIYEARMKSVPVTPIQHEYDPVNYPGETVDTAGNLALITRYDSSTSYAVIYYNAATSTWDLRDANNITLVRGEIGKGPILSPDHWYDIRLLSYGKTLKLWVRDAEDPQAEAVLVGAYQANNVSYPSAPGLIGFGSMGDAKTLYVDSLTYKEYLGVSKPDPEPIFNPFIISSADMLVEMDNRFPVPRQYTVGGKTMQAQQDYAYTLTVNGEEWLAQVDGVTRTADSAVYTVTAYEDKVATPDNYIRFQFTYTVEKTTLKAEIKVLAENKIKLYTFAMGDVSLAQFMGVRGTNASNNNIRSDGFVNPGTWNNTADLRFDLTRNPGMTPYSIAFISNLNAGGNLSVGLMNDSTETPTRNMVNLLGEDDSDAGNVIPKILTLNNGPWVYRGAKNSAQFPNAEDDFPPPASMNFRVLVADDNNGSGKADWQDAANLYREYAPVPLGGSDIRDYFSYVSFNFNSLAQNPFLRGLDDGKKLYNYTDGFGQMILEKGYQAEGHDDSHPDVGNHIGIRQGGVKDFNTLINEGKKYNMKIGVHVNVGEYILDSFFNPPLDYFYTDAGGYPNSQGWGWVDQAFYFDQTKDLLSKELENRFKMLKENAPGLDWIYVDIYNGADWRAKQVSQALADNGWINATEFSGPMEQNVVWTHWGTDLYYPTSGDGSQIFRFIYNDTKDVFPVSSPAVSSMLRGSVQPGIATWQNRTSIEEGARVFYNQNLPSKYMQYFPVSRWEANEITFGAPKDDDGNVVASMAGAKSVLSGTDTKIYAPDGTLVAIMDYVESGGKLEIANNKSQIFIPWSPITEDKIYYWNAKTSGGQTIWTLPASWGDQETVQIYQLKDNGKILVNGAFPVADGQLDLTSLHFNTPYIIYKNGADPLAAADDFGAVEAGGGYIADPGFDTHGFDAWQTKNTDNVTMKLDSRWNGVMEVGAQETTVSNKIVGLTPGKTYTASIWMQIGTRATDTRPVTLRVTDANGINVSKLATRTAVNNMDEPGKWKANLSGQPYPRMTRIEVRFTAGADGRANFLLEIGAGDAVVTFDDARIWENPGKTTFPKDAYYYEDFENVSEGLGPFMYMGGGGNNSHLAEKAPTEINGYATNQYEDYVIDGSWSLKLYEDVARTIVRTTPNTVAFKADTEYTVTFDYTTVVNNVYYASVRNGNGTEMQRLNLAAATKAAPGQATLNFRTPAGDENYYIIIGCASAPGRLHTNFLIVDNFTVVDESEPAAPAPVITSVTVTTSNIAEKLAANLRVNVTGENLEGKTLTAYFSVNGELDETTATDITSGTALMKIKAAPDFGADCQVVVKVDGSDVQGSFTMTLFVYNAATLWSPALDMGEDGKLLVWFGESIGANPKTGYGATVNGTAYACEKADDNALRIDIDFLSLDANAKIVVSGVMYPDLFPSYSFTFTIYASIAR